MASEEWITVEYQAPIVADLGTLADLTAGAGHSTNRDVAGNDSNGKSA
jgi:hypothetical protein